MKFHLPNFQVWIVWSRDRWQIGKTRVKVPKFSSTDSRALDLRALSNPGVSSRAIVSTWLNLGQIGASFSALGQRFFDPKSRTVWLVQLSTHLSALEVIRSSRQLSLKCQLLCRTQEGSSGYNCSSFVLDGVKRRRLNSDSASNRFISDGSAFRIDPDPLLCHQSSTLSQRLRASLIRWH